MLAAPEPGVKVLVVGHGWHSRHRQAWLALNVIAHNLMRWTGRIALAETLLTTGTIRRRFLRVPGHLTRRARGVQLHLARYWPWRHQFLTAVVRIRHLEVCQT